MSTSNLINSFDTSYMREAISLARIALSQDEVPIGAVIVDSVTKKIIGRGYNTGHACCDPTLHAEMIAIKEACAYLKSKTLKGCYIYTTVEPCAMCATAISYARISRVYYGAKDEKFGAIDSNIMIYNSSLTLWIPEVYEGIEHDTCVELIQNYFVSKR